MNCPTCGGDLIVEGGATTLMSFGSHFDDEGRVHSHDPNKTGWSGHCWKGHKWRIITTRPCPAKGCDYGVAEYIEAHS